MKKLCVFSLYDEKGASSRYRILMYKDFLSQHFELKVFKFWSNHYATKYTYNKKRYALIILLEYAINLIKRLWQLYVIAPQYDIIFIQKDTIPGLKHTHIKHLAKGKKIVFDVDDPVYLTSNHSDQIAEAATKIICGNKTLQEHYQKINQECVVIPTVEYTPAYCSKWSDTYNNKIIGWIGTGATLDNLELVTEAIDNITEKHPEVKFHIICNTCGQFDKTIHNVVFVPWNLETYIDELAKITIGIMPLKGREYNFGKCGFKLVQYQSMKKPVIGSDVGVNKEIIGKCGFLANNADEWTEKLEALLFNKEIYDDCIKHIESDFFPHFDFQVNSERLLQVLS